MSEVTLGIVGCGRLAEAGYLPALARVPGARVVAVADPDAARAQAVASPAGTAVATYDDAASLLAGTQVDGLLIASPVAAHVADATAAAVAGVPALVEKPPAPDVVGAAALARLTPAPWIGLNRRFDPGAARVRAARPAGGDIDLTVEIRYRRRSWGAHVAHDDALADLGPHLVDWIRWISGGEVTEVLAATLTADRADVELRTERGRARLLAAADRPHLERIELRSGGRRLASHRLGGPVATVLGRLPSPRPSPLVASLAAQLAAFVAAIGGRPDARLGTAADGLAVMEVLDAARVAAAGQRPMPVPLPV